TLQVLTGIASPRFQWRKQQPFDSAGEPTTNTFELAGATNASLTITNAQPQDEGFYEVVVTDSAGRYQLSAMGCVRVEPLNLALVDQDTLCLNNLKEIDLAARLYASTHNDTSPQSLESLPIFI